MKKAHEPTELLPYATKTLSTGVAVSFSPGYYGMLVSRITTANKGLTVEGIN